MYSDDYEEEEEEEEEGLHSQFRDEDFLELGMLAYPVLPSRRETPALMMPMQVQHQLMKVASEKAGKGNFFRRIPMTAERTLMVSRSCSHFFAQCLDSLLSSNRQTSVILEPEGPSLRVSRSHF